MDDARLEDPRWRRPRLDHQLFESFLFSFVEAIADLPKEAVARWFAMGMLLNVITAMDLHTKPEPWAVRLLEGLPGNQK